MVASALTSWGHSGRLHLQCQKVANIYMLAVQYALAIWSGVQLTFTFKSQLDVTQMQNDKDVYVSKYQRLRCSKVPIIKSGFFRSF